MNRKLSTFYLLLLTYSTYGQIGAIPEIPAVSPADAGFRKYSIDALADTSSKFRQRGPKRKGAKGNG